MRTIQFMDSTELAVRVRTPSRLHFGLLAFGDAAPRQFGGVGVMIDRPETDVFVRLHATLGRSCEPRNVAERRASEFARRFRDSLDSDMDQSIFDRLEIRVQQAAAEHVGLGSGTQLALAVARALAAFMGRPDMPPEELARRVGRGRRSAIGVHGFQYGGFIVESGKRNSDQISPLVARLNFPVDWHFVLITPTNSEGLHGPAEREAFEGLPPIPPAVTADLCRLTLLGILPAIAGHDFAAFSEALVEFGCKVGQCFATFQEGVYASPLAGAVIDLLLRHGIRGIAQSSWGPTLAAIAESRLRAEWIAARLRDSFDSHVLETVCTPANNLGARVEIAGGE